MAVVKHMAMNLVRNPKDKHSLKVRRKLANLDPVYCGPVLRHPAELMLPAVDLGGRVWLGGRSCKGWPAAPAFGG